MDDKFLKEARLKAERAVADMPSGDMKLKAFEVILTQLIDNSTERNINLVPQRVEKQKQAGLPVGQPRSLSARIVTLQADGFFHKPQPIGAVRAGLQERGWHYPVTTLSGTLQGLVRKRILRRERVKEGNKTGWKYSNP